MVGRLGADGRTGVLFHCALLDGRSHLQLKVERLGGGLQQDLGWLRRGQVRRSGGYGIVTGRKRRERIPALAIRDRGLRSAVRRLQCYFCSWDKCSTLIGNLTSQYRRLGENGGREQNQNKDQVGDSHEPKGGRYVQLIV